MTWGELCERLDQLHVRGITASAVDGRLRFANPSRLTDDDREWITPNVARIIALVTPKEPPPWDTPCVGVVVWSTDPAVIGGTWNADGSFTWPTKSSEDNQVDEQSASQETLNRRGQRLRFLSAPQEFD